MPATVRAQVPIAAFLRTAAEIRVIARPIGANLFQVHFEPINRMRAVTALPSGTLKVPYCGESITL